MSQTVSEVESETRKWLEQVVIGLNLCPFARRPYEDDRIRIVTEGSESYDEILGRMLAELRYIDTASDSVVETSIVIAPKALSSFQDYLSCLADINEMLVEEGYEGVFQIASFHPNYQFEGTEPEEASNLTNRSPYPIFHIIREASLSAALESIKNPELIPERNIALMETMDTERVIKLFPWLFQESR
jgi:hypothetical protein